jgi:hypothetical protein
MEIWGTHTYNISKNFKSAKMSSVLTIINYSTRKPEHGRKS